MSRPYGIPISSRGAQTFALVFLAFVLIVGYSQPVSAQSGWWPDIDDVQPESGPEGTLVSVSGSDFGNITQVTFGKTDVSFEQADEETILFEVPDVTPGDYKIELTNADGDDSFCCFQVTAQAPASSTASRPTAATSPSRPAPTVPSVESVDCGTPGRNAQCGALGTVTVPAMQAIEGEPVRTTIDVEISEAFAQGDAEWLMVSIRNVTADGPSPVMVSIEDFSAGADKVFVSKREHTKPNELNLWVASSDVHIGTPLQITVLVGVTERGIYQLETLVMPFDRGYEKITDGAGETLSLFAATLLDVDEPTAPHSVPGADLSAPSLLALTIVVGMTAALVMVGSSRKKSL